MICIAHDPFASEAKAAAIGVRLVSLDEALAQGDFFSLHMPLTSQTKVCWGPGQFASTLVPFVTVKHSISAILHGSYDHHMLLVQCSVTVPITCSSCIVTEYASV